jgi:cyclohexanecarboxylate-CoA ligase
VRRRKRLTSFSSKNQNDVERRKRGENMEFNPVLLARQMPVMRARGIWKDNTIDNHMADALRQWPDKIAIVAYRQDQAEPRRMAYRELDALAERIASSLSVLGIGHQDVVSFQLPNWWEFIALSLACVKIGAAANPLMPILRERELKFMLDLAESKIFIVPQRFRGFDFAAMAKGLQASLPRLEHVIVVDGEGADSFDTMLLKEAPAFAALPARQALAPDDVLLLMFTSGTTGEPKGVMHTSNTILTSMDLCIERLGLTPDDIVLAASPLAHLTGYAMLGTLPLMLGSTTVLQDVWNGKQGLEIIEQERVSFTAASTPFLTDLCTEVAAGAPRPSSFRLFMCAGAPIPPAMVERALNDMQLAVCSAFGMTEVCAAAVTEPARAGDKSSSTDGLALPNVEFRVADEFNGSLPTGETGRLLIKTPALFGGYLKHPELNGIGEDGWFDTGDLAYMDADGYIRINGRSKDIVIRGGENIPVVAVENLLYAHPAVAAVAIVAYPDARMGERACAFIVPRPGMTFTFADMTAYFNETQLTNQYRPERLEIVDDLPRTATGKIQKYQLRELAKQFGNG